VSNVSFGLKPAPRKVLNSVFLHYAREHGLDAAILHSGSIVPLYKIDDHQRTVAEDLVFDRRREGYDPLERLLNIFADVVEEKVTTDRRSKKVEDRLKLAIIDGDRTQLEDDITEALATYRPLDIINEILLDGMKTVGDLFGAGQMQLPFVLKSAEAMKAAVAFLEPYMDKASATDKGSLVLATVRGDVHDIGKNLVPGRHHSHQQRLQGLQPRYQTTHRQHYRSLRIAPRRRHRYVRPAGQIDGGHAREPGGSERTRP
jgi:5-methyltetrahydrofolate--homocysteine methyltransferase